MRCWGKPGRGCSFRNHPTPPPGSAISTATWPTKWATPLAIHPCGVVTQMPPGASERPWIGRRRPYLGAALGP